MKKITFIFLFAILPLVGFAQSVFNFTNSADGWAPNNGNTVATNNPTFVNLSFNTGNNGRFENAAVSVNADDAANSYVAITLRNNAATGPTYLRFGFNKIGAGIKYIGIDINQADTGFRTYYVKLKGDNEWSGMKTELRIQFKKSGNVTFSGNGETVDIDKIEFLSALPTTLKMIHNFNVDGDLDFWTADQAILTPPNGGNGSVFIEPVPIKFVKFKTLTYHADATNNKYVHVTLKNNSAANDQLRFLFEKADGSNSVTTQPISTSDSGYVTYDFDLSSDTEWTGNKTITIGIGSVLGADGFDDTLGPDGIANNGDEANDDGKPIDTGIMEIDSIIIDSVLGVNDFVSLSFSLFPNPAKNVLNINSINAVSKVQIFDITGKQVLEDSTLTNNQVNISALNTGLYLVKMFDINNNNSTKKLIIE